METVSTETAMTIVEAIAELNRRAEEIIALKEENEGITEELVRLREENERIAHELAELRALEMNHEGACVRLKRERDEAVRRWQKCVGLLSRCDIFIPDTEPQLDDAVDKAIQECVEYQS